MANNLAITWSRSVKVKRHYNRLFSNQLLEVRGRGWLWWWWWWVGGGGGGGGGVQVVEERSFASTRASSRTDSLHAGWSGRLSFSYERKKRRETKPPKFEAINSLFTLLVIRTFWQVTLIIPRYCTQITLEVPRRKTNINFLRTILIYNQENYHQREMPWSFVKFSSLIL